MEALLALALAAALLAVAVRLQRRSNTVWSQRLDAIADAYDGLTANGRRDDARLEGTHGGVRLAVDAYLALPGQLSSITTRVRVDTSLPPGLTLDREGAGSALAKLAGGEDLVIGDPAFDAAFRVRADDVLAAVAHLDAPARAALVDLAATHAARVDGGQLILTRSGYATPDELREMIDAALAAGLVLGRRDAPVAWLERTVFDDPLGAVRLNAFYLVLSELAGNGAEAFASRALTSPDPTIAGRARAFLSGHVDSGGRLSVVGATGGELSVSEVSGAPELAEEEVAEAEPTRAAAEEPA